jgi:nitroimidazol reductase NimA-like FMN-containing flavoprotein (pyridoxamine 5'-phosphate oxidase superfamily)
MGLHEPRRRDKIIADRKDIDRVLERGTYAVIAMSRNDEPYVVTLNYGYDESNNCLYFHCAKEGEKLGYLDANPRVCATVIEDRGYLEGRCDHDYASLVIRGELRRVEGLEAKKKGLSVLLRHLEKNPAEIVKEHVKDDGSYEGLTILRLGIESIAGKEYKG